MKIEILDVASLEIEDGKEYYNMQQDKLGDVFKNDIKIAINNIASFPKLYPILERDLRRYLLHRFPYSVIYAIMDESIVVVAVAHQRRKPYYLSN